MTLNGDGEAEVHQFMCLRHPAARKRATAIQSNWLFRDKWANWSADGRYVHARHKTAIDSVPTNFCDVNVPFASSFAAYVGGVVS
jgi:hypothetical protein